MKKHALMVVIGMVALSMLAGPLLAEGKDAPTTQKHRRGQGRGRFAGGHTGERQRRIHQGLRKLIESMDLSEEKEAAVGKILSAQKEAAGKSRRENRQRMAQLKEVLNEEQMAEVKKFFAKVRPKRPGDPGGRPDRPGRRALAGLDLTDEQKAKIAAIHKEAAERIKAEVLTAEQREKLKKMRKRGDRRPGSKGDQRPGPQGDRRPGRPGKRRAGPGRRPFAGLELTDAQKEKVAAIHKEAAEKIEAAETPEEKREIRRASWRRIADEVLTDQQRKELRERREKFRGEGRGEGRGGRRDRPRPEKDKE